MTRKAAAIKRAKTPPAPEGKGEDPAPEGPLQQHGASETMALIRSAIRRRWVIPERIYEAAPAIVGRILLDPATDTREKIRAVQTLAMLDRNNTDLVVEADRMERLHQGMSTDNVALVSRISDEQLNAVAQSILPKKRSAK